MPRPHLHRLTALFMGVFLALSMVAVDHAEARRGGSFGSRGSRTFQRAPITRTAPRPVAPVERSMTPNPGPTNAVRQPGATAAPRNGLRTGFFGGSLFRGLMLGGLIGLLFGHGLGGAAGALGLLVQLLLLGGLIWLAMRLLGGRSQPAHAAAGGARMAQAYGRDEPRAALSVPRMGSEAAPGADSTEVELGQADLDMFERRLSEVQEAFSREDHAALRRLATPEMVSFLSEELADNAKRGVRNDVSDVRLLQADIAESWREAGEDYATAALLYEARDVTRERGSGRIVEGTDAPTETTELWTFRRSRSGDWKLSAIQEA